MLDKAISDQFINDFHVAFMHHLVKETFHRGGVLFFIAPRGEAQGEGAQRNGRTEGGNASTVIEHDEPPHGEVSLSTCLEKMELRPGRRIWRRAYK
jgi:hypothetical protein